MNKSSENPCLGMGFFVLVIFWQTLLVPNHEAFAMQTKGLENFLPKGSFALVQVKDFDKVTSQFRKSSIGTYLSAYFQSDFLKEIYSRFHDVLANPDVQRNMDTIRESKPKSGSFALYNVESKPVCLSEFGPFSSEEYSAAVALIDAYSRIRPEITEFDTGGGKVVCHAFRFGTWTCWISYSGDRIIASTNEQELHRAIRFLIDPGSNSNENALANTRKFAIVQKRLFDKVDSVVACYFDPSALIDVEWLRKNLGPENFQQLVESGLLDVVCVGASIGDSDKESIWKLNLMIPVTLPRRGFFGALAWEPVVEGFESMVPGDCRFLAAYRFSVANSFESLKMLLGRFGDEMFVKSVSSWYFGITNIVERHASYLDGFQVAFLVDTHEKLDFSSTIARAYRLHSEPPADEIAIEESVAEQLLKVNYEQVEGTPWIIWSQNYNDWQEKRKSYEKLAATQKHLPQRIVYPRISVALAEGYFLRFKTWESTKKCYESRLAGEHIGQQEWYQRATKSVYSQENGRPHFLLVARKGTWIQFALNIIDDQTTTIESRVQPYLKNLKKLPRLDDEHEQGIPAIAVAAWDRPDGIYVIVSEIADP